MTIARPLQTGKHDVRADFLDLPPLIKPDITEQVLYYWDAAVVT